MSPNGEICDHLREFDLIHPKEKKCDKCIEMGDRWVHLRVCQTCGVESCCDSSKNKHATKHFNEAGHPVITSAEQGDKWAWCYNDEMFTEY